MSVRVKHIGEERHDHQKHLTEACDIINSEGGRVTSVEHTATTGAYDRMMVSTLIFYEVDDAAPASENTHKKSESSSS